MTELQPGLKKERNPIKDNNCGVYILELWLKENARLSHALFESVLFNSGYYYYSGSAQKNLNQRIERHCRKKKAQHWHIDYLTTLSKVEIKKVITFPGIEKNGECRLISNLTNRFQDLLVIKNFGNSDCRQCDGHLLYSKTPVDLNFNLII